MRETFVTRRIGIVFAAFFAFAGTGNASPVGSQFRVNTTISDDQWQPSVAGLAPGGFVVVWQSGGIFGQLYNATATSIGGEFRIDSSIQRSNFHPVVAGLTNGGFVAVWESSHPDGPRQVNGQLYSVGGAPNGTQFRVGHKAGSSLGPTVGALKDGGYVVAWFVGSTLYGQRFNRHGKKIGDEFVISQLKQMRTTNRPAISGLPGGGFVVTWTAWGEDRSKNGIFGQRYRSDGEPARKKFQVNSYYPGNQIESSVAGLIGGGFVVTWSSTSPTCSDGCIYGQRFDGKGARTGGEFQINTTKQVKKGNSSVAALADGGFVVTWSDSDVYGQRFDAAGAQMGGEFRINTSTAGSQESSAVAALSDGGFVAAWESYNSAHYQNGFDIYAQRFSP